MDPSLLSILTNGISGSVVVILIILGYLVPRPAVTRLTEENDRKDEIIAKLTEALALERQRSNDANAAGAVTNQLIGGLVRLAGGHHDDGAPALPGGPLDLTGKDVGL